MLFNVLLILSLLINPATAYAQGENPAGYTIPESIRVIITGNAECDEVVYGKVETIDFKEYVKGVLPNEWGKDWDEDSLKAGAIAVKMFAWSYIAAGGKWRGADVCDCNFDQVYNPAFRTAATDKAVDDTWDFVLVDSSGNLFRTCYNAWASACYQRGLYGYCMGQWDSLKHAEVGKSWQEILFYYYKGSRLIDLSPKPIFRDIREQRLLWK